MASGTATRSVEEIRTALNTCYSAVEALCADLAEAQWQMQSLCPEWTVRGVIDHLTSVEAVLAGWLPEDAAAIPPFERAGEFLAQTASLDGDQYLDKVRAVYARRRRDLDALSQGDVERPSWTPVGPGTYGKFLAIRVFDFWVHVRDMTTPLGLSTDDTGLAAEMALAEVEGSLSYIVGKKVGLPDGKSIVFHLTGPLAAEYAVAVDGRAKQVERLDNPDVEVSTDSTTFIQLACGRIDPQGPIDARTITWSGDAELGERAARNLRYTM